MFTSATAAPALAIEVTPETDADVLAGLLFPGTDGLLYTPGSATLDGHTTGVILEFDEFGEPVVIQVLDAFSSGTFTNASGSYGIGTGAGTDPEGIVLGTGDVRYAQDIDIATFVTDTFNVPATLEQEDLLSPVTNQFHHYDVTQLTIPFENTTGGPTALDITVVFATEEFPDFVGTEFNDGFAAYLNGTNIALAAGQLMNVDHPQMAPILNTPLAGVISELEVDTFDPRIQISGTADPGANTLTLVIGDASDEFVDSAVYVTRDTIDGPVPDQPRLPDAIDPETGGFIFDDLGGLDEDVIFIDPDVAIGYTYDALPSATDPDPKFDGVIVPLVVGDGFYTASYGSVVSQEFFAGEFVNFLFDEPEGVSSFTITGIEPEAMVDASDPLAFVTGISFVGDTTSVTVVQTPIIPEPAAGVALVSSFGWLACKRRRGMR